MSGVDVSNVRGGGGGGEGAKELSMFPIISIDVNTQCFECCLYSSGLFLLSENDTTK